VVSTLAQSYGDRAATGVGAVTEMAAERKLAKYSNLASNFISERELLFMFAICRRPSVCLSSVVCNVRAPYSGD